MFFFISCRMRTPIVARKTRKPSGYWTRAKVLDVSRKYVTRSEFRHNDLVAYTIASSNGWLDDMTWLAFPQTYRHLTFDLVQAESRKYAGMGRKAFQKGSSSAYKAAKRNGWLGSFPWLFKANPYTTRMHVVYRYVFEEAHAIYIGLTMNAKRRDYEHRHPKGNKESAVFRFYKEHNVCIPAMEIVKDKLDVRMAQDLEGSLVEKYKMQGWVVLNSGAVGEGSSSIGMAARKWTRHKVFEEARKYRYRGDFYKFSPSAYEKARSNHWIDDMDWFESRPYIVSGKKQQCQKKHFRHVITEMEVRSEAKCFKTRKAFALANRRLHAAAVSMGIIDEIFPRLRAEYGVVAIAKDGTRQEFKNAYHAARTLGVCRGVIRKCCLGQLKTAYGYIWRKIGA